MLKAPLIHRHACPPLSGSELTMSVSCVLTDKSNTVCVIYMDWDMVAEAAFSPSWAHSWTAFPGHS